MGKCHVSESRCHQCHPTRFSAFPSLYEAKLGDINSCHPESTYMPPHVTILANPKPLVEVRCGRKYARVEVDLYRTAFRLSLKGVKRINGFLARYTIARQVLYKPYGATRDVVTCYVLREDLHEVLRKLLRMVKRYSQPIGRLGGR